MPYGVKRGVKAPGDYGVSDMLGLGLAGATGIVAALITDFQQKGEASALFTINQWAALLGDFFGFGHLPLWTVTLAIIGVGAGSIFYFQPITRQGAFAQGFGLLAVLMTAVPPDLAAGLSGMSDDDLPGLQPASVSTAVFTQEANAELTEVQQRRAAVYNVTLTVNLPNGTKDDVRSMIRRGTLRGRLHNGDTGNTYNIFRNAGGDLRISNNKIVIRAGVPARSESATLWVRIELDGYAIEEQSAQAQLGRSLNWPITMRPSSTPLFLQRLQKSYWF
ncbi:MAG: hypothetical protein AAF224_06975 [Pseudomonadota bacterium]